MRESSRAYGQSPLGVSWSDPSTATIAVLHISGFASEKLDIFLFFLLFLPMEIQRESSFSLKHIPPEWNIFHSSGGLQENTWSSKPALSYRLLMCTKPSQRDYWQQLLSLALSLSAATHSLSLHVKIIFQVCLKSIRWTRDQVLIQREFWNGSFKLPVVEGQACNHAASLHDTGEHDHLPWWLKTHLSYPCLWLRQGIPVPSLVFYNGEKSRILF